MAFLRTRTIKGKKYRYREERWREGGKVRSKSVYLGSGEPRGSFLDNFKVRRYGMPDEEQGLKSYNELVARDEAVKQAGLEKLHGAYGLKMGSSNPVPVEKPTPVTADVVKATAAPSAPSAASPAEPSQPSGQSSDAGEGTAA